MGLTDDLRAHWHNPYFRYGWNLGLLKAYCLGAVVLVPLSLFVHRLWPMAVTCVCCAAVSAYWLRFTRVP